MRCICGKRLRVKDNGELGKTCGSKSCAGKMGKKRMLELGINNSSLFVGKTPIPYWREVKRFV